MATHSYWPDSYRDSGALCPVRVIKNRRQIKHTIFAYVLLNLVNFVPIDLKIGTHIDWTYNMYHAKNCTNKNNVTRISLATKYPIIKDRPISDTHNVYFRDGRRWISLQKKSSCKLVKLSNIHYAGSSHTYSDNKRMSIDANNNRSIRELLINNPPTCSIWHSGPWADNARN